MALVIKNGFRCDLNRMASLKGVSHIVVLGSSIINLSPISPIISIILLLYDRISNPDISRVGCDYMQGIRAADVVVYLKALITRKMGALGSPEG